MCRRTPAGGEHVTSAGKPDVALFLPRNYLRPCLLLLLAEGTAHGYELLDQTSELGLLNVDPGGLYRCLRAMDEEGLVESRWEPSSIGPARRTYALTREGRDWLRAVSASLVQVHGILELFQHRLQRLEVRDAVT